MDKVTEVLTRGVEKIYPSKEELEKVLRSEKKIRLYNGIDPTGPQLHLGHMVVLRKLRQFQKLGHHIILLIGDFTGRIGDPSGKSETRKPMTQEELLKNAKNYQEQAGKILDFSGPNPVEIKYNSLWLDKLNFEEVMHLGSLVTYPQVIERDMFQRRLKEGKDIFVSELFYPLMQGYDSVAMDIDLEVGGSDQTFNMLMGRTLMKKMKGKEKFVLTTKLLAEPGKEKMGKTTNNLIALEEKPAGMFGKIMAWSDEMITCGFELLTDVSPEEISAGASPMDAKKKLAWEIVAALHTKEEASNAQAEFERVFQKKETPTEIETIRLPETLRSGATVTDILAASGLVSSRAEAKRVISQGGTAVAGQLITDPNAPFPYKDETILRVGKRRFVKIKL